MPTFTIRSGLVDPIVQKKLALAIAKLLRDHWVELSHAIVVFETISEHSVFSGGVKLPVLAHESARPNLFLVQGFIGEARGQNFRSDVAQKIFEFLSDRFPNSFVYIQFDVVRGGYAFYSRGDKLECAGSASVT